MPDHPGITKNLTVRRLAYKTGLRLMRIEFIRSAVDDQADLSAFNYHLPRRLIGGLLLICLSNLICWPGISLLAGVALREKKPLLAAVGGPVIYGVTFCCSIIGMVLCTGAEARIFLRWRVRRWVDWLLAHGPADVEPPLSTDEHRSEKEGSG